MFTSHHYALFTLILATVWLLLTVLALFHRPRWRPEMLYFRHAWWLRGLTFVVGPVLSLFFAIMATVEPPGPAHMPIFVGFCGGFALLGGVSYWETIRFAVALTPDGIDYVAPWWGRRIIPWSAVRSLSYNRVPGTFILNTDQGTVRVGLAVPRVGKFVEECERQLPIDQLKGAIDGYSAIGRYFPYKGSRR